MRSSAMWILAGALAVGLAACGAPPESEVAQEPVTAAEPEPAAEAEEPVVEEPELEEAKPEPTPEVSAPKPVVSASNVWAPGKEGKLLMGLDGGLYEPYRVSLIEEAQRALQAKGFYTGEVHGYLDEETMKALGEFQEQNGLKPSGVLTPRTRQALMTNAPDAT